MKLTIYQIDAFAEKQFEGNPAAVVPLETWLPDEIMGAIAEENNLAETAFFVPEGDGFHIRWFTPSRREIRLCGHATLASAFVLFEYLGFSQDIIKFNSLSGELSVLRSELGLTLDFPTQLPQPCDTPEEMFQGLGVMPTACFEAEDYIAVFDSQQDVLALEPNFAALAMLERRGVIVTAPSEEYDFVARFFAPKYGIAEDPVTGSAYTQLMPYWAGVLGETVLRARQLSQRGGNLHCELKDDRVLISGSAVKYMQGEIEVNL